MVKLSALGASGSETVRKELCVTPDQPENGDSPVRILELHQDYSYKELFKVVRARLQYQRFDGNMSAPLTRLNFERGESVGILLYDPQDDTVILARQFRFPVYASLPREQREGDSAWRAWLLEIIAGVKDPGLELREVANKELIEEAGYKVEGELRPIATYYPSPGGTSERITLFWAEVNHREQTGKGGGVLAEGEDIQIVVIPFAEAIAMVTRGEINDGKTLIALQHLALWKAGVLGHSGG
jgi:nudix-type nucleoside diphosphatase (YffH/AdpP family)